MDHDSKDWNDWLADDDFTDDELGQLFDLEQPEDVE